MKAFCEVGNRRHEIENDKQTRLARLQEAGQASALSYVNETVDQAQRANVLGDRQPAHLLPPDVVLGQRHDCDEEVEEDHGRSPLREPPADSRSLAGLLT